MKRIMYILIPALIYGFFAFVMLEPNPAEWGAPLRYLFASLVLGGIGFTYTEIGK